MFKIINSKNIYKSSYFKNLIFSYLFILIIPLCLTIYFVFNMYFNQFKYSIESEYNTYLDKTTSYLDKEFENISNLLTQLNINSTIRPFNLEDDPTSSIRLQEQLRTSITINKNVFEIFLYFKSDKYMHSSTTSIALDYLNLRYKLGVSDTNMIIELLNNCKGLKFLPTQSITSDSNKKTILPILFPYKSSGTIMVFIDVDQLLSPITYNDYTYFSVLNREGNTILSTLPNDLAMHDISSLDSHSSDVITIGGRKYLCTRSTSHLTGLTYMYLTDSYLLFKSFYSYLFICILIITFIVLLLLCLVNYFANKHYSPVQALEQLANNIHHIDLNKDISIKNEFLHIQSTLEYLHDSNKALDNKYENIKYYGHDSLLFGLLNGSFGSLKEFNQKGEPFGIYLSQGVYTLLVIRFTHDTLTQNDVYELLLTNCPTYLHQLDNVHIQKHLENNKLILLITQEQENSDQLIQATHLLKDLLSSHGLTSIHIGVGNTYAHFQLIPKSYIEAFNALKYRFVKSLAPIICFKECILDEYSTTFYTAHYISSLKEHIYNENLSGINGIIDELKDQFRDRQLPLFTVQGICFDVINEIFSYFNQHHISNGNKLPPVNFYELSHYDTLDKLFEFLNATCFKICNALDHPDNTANTHPDNAQIKEMIEYIEFHCCNPDFSTAQMASDFNTSAPALSLYFKNMTGQTISAYLTDYRLSKAKDILLTTSLPLTEVCKEVGYYNVSSFIRRFKSVEGISPGAYRDMHQNHPVS